MSCATKPGVKWVIEAIREISGPSISQGTWHQLRNAAFSTRGAVPSRARAEAYEIAAAADLIARANRYRRQDGSIIDKKDMRAEALESIGKTTKGTCLVVEFMSKFQMTEIIEAANTASNVGQTKCDSCSASRPTVEWRVGESSVTASCGECGCEIAKCVRHDTKPHPKVTPHQDTSLIEGRREFTRDGSGGVSCRSCGNSDLSWFFPCRGDRPTHGLDPLWDRKSYFCGKCNNINVMGSEESEQETA